MRPRQHEGDVGINDVTFRNRSLLKILKGEAKLLLFKTCDAGEKTKLAMAMSFAEIQPEDFVRCVEPTGSQLGVHRRTDLGFVEFLWRFDHDLCNWRCREKTFTKLLKIHFLRNPTRFANMQEDLG